MSTKIDNFNKRRLRSSNITVIISISLVLFLIGLIGMIAINASSYIDYIKEQMKMEVYFKDDDQNPERSIKLQQEYLNKVRTSSFIKSAKYISKDQAVKIGKKELGVDSEALFEKKIFPASILIVLKPEYVDSIHVEAIKTELMKSNIVDEVNYNSELLSLMSARVNQITMGITILALIILFIAISLINNSIRLKIYAKRFIIKTMQLVGAKRFFIMKPFLSEAAVLGTIGGVISLILLYAVNYTLIQANILPPTVDYTNHILLSLFILVLGVLITTISTWFATWRFLKLKLDDLYYS